MTNADPKAWMVRNERDETLGPFSRAEIVQRIAEGEMGPKDRVRFGESGAWKQINEVTTFAVAWRETRGAAGRSRTPLLMGTMAVVLLLGVVVSWRYFQPTPSQQLTQWFKAHPIPKDGRAPGDFTDANEARELAAYSACVELSDGAASLTSGATTKGPEADEARFNAIACRLAHGSIAEQDWASVVSALGQELERTPRRGFLWASLALLDPAQNALALGEATSLETAPETLSWVRTYLQCQRGCEAQPNPGGSAIRVMANLRAGKLKRASTEFLRTLAAKPRWCELGLCDSFVRLLSQTKAVDAFSRAHAFTSLPAPLLRLLVPRIPNYKLAAEPEPRPAALEEVLADKKRGLVTSSLSDLTKRDDAWLATVSDTSPIEQRFFAAVMTKGARAFPVMAGPLPAFYRAVFSAQTDETLRLDELLQLPDALASYNPEGLALYDAGLRDVVHLTSATNGGAFLHALARAWLGEPVTEPEVLVASKAYLQGRAVDARAALREIEEEDRADDDAVTALMSRVLEALDDEAALEWWRKLDGETGSKLVRFAGLRERAQNGEASLVYEEALAAFRSGERDPQLAELLWRLEP